MEYLQSKGFIKPLLFQSNSGSGTVSFIINYNIKMHLTFKGFKIVIKLVYKECEIKFTCDGLLEKD